MLKIKNIFSNIIHRTEFEKVILLFEIIFDFIIKF